MKILFLDLETSPNLAFVWGLWDQNVAINQLMESTEVICFGARWHGEKKVTFRSTHHDGKKKMLKDLHALMEEADVLVGWNSAAFDSKHIKREFLEAGMLPPSPYKELDLMRVVKSQFKFPSNKLDFVAQALGLGSKLAHEGQGLWTACLAGDDKAWARMRRYNKQDVVLTEALYDRMGAWIKSHPHMGLFTHQARSCFRCGGTSLTANGVTRSASTAFASFTCDACGAQSRASTRKHGVVMRGVR